MEINEKKHKKKKADGYRSVRKRADKNPKVTQMDFLPDELLNKIAKGKNLDEKSGPKPSKYQKTKYKARGKRGKSMARTSKAYSDAKKAGRKPPSWIYDEREKQERIARNAPGYKTRKRSDSMKESFKLTRAQLRRLIMETLEANMLDSMPEDDETNLDEKLSAATIKTLKNKADKRGLTLGSVKAEYRKGLAAWASSGSRKGMSQHQWAHARVNSANPSKSWAVVKKKKGGKKKKKK